MLKQGVTSEEVIKIAEAGDLPALLKPEAQIPLIRLVGQQGHSTIVAQVIVEESTTLLKEEQPFPIYKEHTTEPEVSELETAHIFAPDLKSEYGSPSD